jgi:hypothetical protein
LPPDPAARAGGRHGWGEDVGPDASARQPPPAGSAVGLLGWKAGIRSDAFGRIPFSEAAAKIDRGWCGVCRRRQHESRLHAQRPALADVKERLAQLGLRVAAYRIDAIPSDAASRQKLVDFVRALEIELVLTRQADRSARRDRRVEDARGVYKQGEKRSGPTCAMRPRPRRLCSS